MRASGGRPSSRLVAPPAIRTTRVPGSSASSAPCGWTLPGMCIGSRSQSVRSASPKRTSVSDIQCLSDQGGGADSRGANIQLSDNRNGSFAAPSVQYCTGSVSGTVVSPVPEPPSGALLRSGLVGFAGLVARERRANQRCGGATYGHVNEKGTARHRKG